MTVNEFCHVVSMPWDDIYQSIDDVSITKVKLMYNELNKRNFSKEELILFFINEPPLEFPSWLDVDLGVSGVLIIKFRDKMSKTP